MSRARPGDVVRSIAFYVAFYSGTLPFVLAAFAVLPFGAKAFRRVAKNWPRYHRVCLRHLLGIRIEIEGTLPASVMLVAIKHESFFEALDQPLMFPDAAIFAKAELLRIPLWGLAGRTSGLIPVERASGAKALRAMLKAARKQTQAGRALVIFPEGTRVPHGTRPPLQAGFAGIYKLLGLPVLPVAVDSGPIYHRRWKRPGVIHVRIGDPIPAGLPRLEIEARVLAAINALNPPLSGQILD